METTASKTIKGAITTEYTVWCGLCDEWFQESARTKEKAKKEFKKAGWRLTKAMGWICPDHNKVVVPRSTESCISTSEILKKNN